MTAAFRADGYIHADEPYHDFYGGYFYPFSLFVLWIDQLLDCGNTSFLVAMRQKTEIQDFHKTIRQHMHQKSSDELNCFKGHGFFAVIITAVPVNKRNFSILDGDNPVMGYGHPVRIRHEVIKHSFRFLKERLV